MARYLAGEADAPEVEKLKSWLRNDPAHTGIFRQYRKSWSLLQAKAADEHISLDEEWEALSARTGIQPEAVSRKLFPSGRRSIVRAAAIAVILILPSLLYFWLYMHPGEDRLVASKQVVESTLPDGTQVALNSGSSLEYPSRFTGKERKVRLKGEAFFEVSHDAEKAFVIDAEDLEIRVLGTSFYVNTASDNNNMEVALMSGSVKLEYRGKQMLLEPGEKAVVLRQYGEIVKQPNKDPNLLAWKTGILRFNNTPLSDIIDVLQKVYHKDIRAVNPEILHCRITATFEGESLQEVLTVLQSTIDLQVRPNGNAIELSGEGCH